MPIVTTASGYSYKQYPFVQELVTATQIISPDGKTTLDTTNNNLDQAHLVLHGDLDAAHSYIKCEKVNGDTPFLVKYDGSVETVDVKLPGHNSVKSTLTTLNASSVDNSSDIAYIDQELVVLNGYISSNTNQVSKIAHATTATPNPDSGSLVQRATSGNATEINILRVNQIQAVAPLPDISVYGRGALTYVPQDINDQNIAGYYRFGKSLEFLGDYDPVGPGDGLYFERNNNELQLEVQPDAPTIMIKGTKNTNVDYFQIRDSSDVVLFAVNHDGDVHGGHLLQDVALDVPDTESNSSLLSNRSLYIGPIRVSYENGKLVQKHITTIPIALAAAPFNVTNADLGGRPPSDLSCRQWCVLARIKSGDHTIKARNVFPIANESEWTELGNHHANDLTSGAQAQIDTAKSDIVDLETLTTTIDTDLTTLENTVAGLSSAAPELHLRTVSNENTAGTKTSIGSNNRVLIVSSSSLDQEHHLLLPASPDNGTEIEVQTGSTENTNKIILYPSPNQALYTSASGDSIPTLIAAGEIEMWIDFAHDTMLDSVGQPIEVGEPVRQLLGRYPDNGDLLLTTTQNNLLKSEFGETLSISNTGSQFYVLDNTTQNNDLDLNDGTFVVLLRTPGPPYVTCRYWDSHFLKLYVTNAGVVRLKSFTTFWNDFQTLDLASDYLIEITYTNADDFANMVVTVNAERLSDGTISTYTKSDFTNTLQNQSPWDLTKYLYAQGNAHMSSIVHCQSTAATIVSVKNNLRNQYKVGTGVGHTSVEVTGNKKLVWNNADSFWMTPSEITPPVVENKIRIYNTSDSTSSNYTGHYNSFCQQISVADTNVIAFWEDYGSTGHTASPYFALPKISTVPIGTTYTFRNATKNRHMHVRAFGPEGSPEDNIYTGLTDQTADGSSDRLTSNYSNMKKLEFTCIARANGDKIWFGNFVETG